MTERRKMREIAELLEEAAEQNPSFWRELREEIGRVRMNRDGPPARADPAPAEPAVQADAPAGESRPAQDAEPAAVRADAPAEEPRPVRDAEPAAAPDQPREDRGHVEARAHSPEWARRPYQGCWNCEARGHYYNFPARVAEEGASERQSPKDIPRERKTPNARSASRSTRRQPPSSERQSLLRTPVALREAPAASPGVNRLLPSASRSTRHRPLSSERQSLLRSSVTLREAPVASPGVNRLPPERQPLLQAPVAVREASTASPERQQLFPAPAAAPGASRLLQALDRTQPLPVHLQTKRPKADAPTDCRPGTPEPDPQRDQPERPRTPRVCLVVSDDSDHGSTPRRAYLADAVTQTKRKTFRDAATQTKFKGGRHPACKNHK
ncbi:PREDICTED: skin secretory protein xP2-like [Vollenhovia emeryi]|uniref:skin secretory protein xP2-like n=1 Tax=Vollenhovia emeryi TaxID=411798 RepID=UPI0005F451D9|nr:PREDICTED: skin secretory protein xP2-like [Vollenhovia emeryi]